MQKSEKMLIESKTILTVRNFRSLHKFVRFRSKFLVNFFALYCLIIYSFVKKNLEGIFGQNLEKDLNFFQNFTLITAFQTKT